MEKKTLSMSYEASVLLVDDDKELRTLVEEYLASHGFDVTGVHDGQKMDEHLAADGADLLILDLHLPGENGLSIARRVSAGHHIPIIILSKQGDDVDRIIGLEAGADDYLPKPFNPRELLARIRAVLRRAPSVEKTRYTFGDMVFLTTIMTLEKDNSQIKLTKSEASLLSIFCKNPHSLLSRDELVQNLKGYERMPDDRSVDVCVTRLRHKIDNLDKSNRNYIHTVRGQGYEFIPEGHHR